MVYHLNLQTETVARAHPAEAFCVEPCATAREVYLALKEQRQDSVLICRDGLLVGIFTERDALQLLADGADLDVPIQQVMSADPVAISVDDTVQTAITRMSEGGYRRLPIVDQAGCPVGVLKVRGILRYLVEHFPKFVYNLPPMPHQATEQREGA